MQDCFPQVPSEWDNLCEYALKGKKRAGGFYMKKTERETMWMENSSNVKDIWLTITFIIKLAFGEHSLKEKWTWEIPDS